MSAPPASRQAIEDEYALKVERCQARYRVEAEAILRARKHLSPLAPLIRARELLADIYRRETAEIATIVAEQNEKLRSVGVDVTLEPPTPRPSTGSSGSPTKSPSALEAAEADYLRLPSLPESVASAKRKTPSPNPSPGQSPEHFRTRQSPETLRIRRESLEHLKLPTPALAPVELYGSEPLYEPPAKKSRPSPRLDGGTAQQRKEVFESLLAFARGLTGGDEHKEFLEKIQADFDAVNRG